MTRAHAYVIIPVFNKVEHLRTCLDSIVSQARYDECNVIIVDDGSTDGSTDICREYAQGFANIRLVRTENHGLGAARNRGLAEIPDQAHGYVTFLDSDDYWDPGYLDSFLSLAVGEPDVIAGRIEGISETPKWAWHELFGDEPQWVSSVDEVPILFRDVSCCDKFFSLELVRRLQLTFAENRHFEDLWFTPEAMLCANGIVINPYAVYRYRMGDSDSIMTNAFAVSQNYWDHLAAAEHVLGLAVRHPERPQGLVEDLAAYANQWFVHRAADVMDSSELARYCAETERVFSQVSETDLVRPSTSWSSRRAYLAIARGDVDRLKVKAPSLDEARIVDGHVMYTDELIGLKPDPLRARLPEKFALRAWLGYFDVTSSDVTFHGHVQVRDMAVDAPSSTIKPALRVAGRTFVGQWARRGDALASTDPHQVWSGFSVIVPVEVSDLAHGRHSVILVLVDATHPEREATCALQANGGLLREARLVALRNYNIVPVTDEKNWVELLIGPRRTVCNKLVWRAARARSALKQGQPFARLKVVATVLSLLPGKPVWLLAERDNTAQDNSAAFFRYLRQEHSKSIDAYYVIDSDAKQRERVADLGNVVDRGSRKHVLLMLRARVLISAFDIDRYMLPPQWKPDVYRRHLAWFLGTPRVFLNHGVSYTDVSQALARRYTGVSVFVTSGASEAEFARDRMDYTDQVVTTGLPRFDLLERRSVSPRRLVFMPTWRHYLTVGEEGTAEYAKFLQSRYWSFISAFLKSPRLHEILQENDLVLEVYPHYEVESLLSAAVEADDRLVMIDQSVRTVRESLGEASLFITDWTSVLFDAAYLGLPIVHAPFDEDEFLTRHYRPGFFEFERDAFGPVVREPDALVEAIEQYASGGFVREPVYTQRAEDFFAKRGGHSDATYEAIQELLRQRK